MPLKLRIPWNKGLKLPPLSLEIRNKIREGNLGKKMSSSSRLKISNTLKGHKVSNETKIKIKESVKKTNYKHDRIIKNQISRSSLNMWKNKREKILKNFSKRHRQSPNKKEKILICLIENILPNTYRFTGNKKFMVGGFYPDFVCIEEDKKFIIELFGDYWHRRKEVKKRDLLRTKTYEKFGYRTLIIWEKELENQDIVRKKILSFHYQRNFNF